MNSMIGWWGTISRRLSSQRLSTNSRLCLTLLLLAGGLLGQVSQALAYTPDDKVVVDMVDRGIRYLETCPMDGVRGEYAGGHILIGYTVYKVTADKDHPLVKRGLQAALERAQTATDNPRLHHKIVYDASVAALFLADFDAAEYRSQLIQVRDFLRYAQKGHGGFGYLDTATGDTSQTQYAMLAMWAMSKNDIDIPTEMVENTLRYLAASQDPSGGWGYQAKLPNGNGLVAQDAVTKSLATAGIGATLIGADILGILGKRALVEEDPDIPKAFVRVDLIEREREKLKNSGVGMKLDDLRVTIEKAVDYQRRFPNPPLGKGWLYYYRYSEERYESFVEVLAGKGRDRSPAWYNAGVNELKRLQDPSSGAWGTLNSDICPPEVCTAFAILYLIRSTQKTIAKMNEGFQVGGYSLPSDTSTIRRVGDKIVSEETASVDGLLELMEKNGTENIEVGLLPENLTLSTDTTERKAQVGRLARLLRSQDWKSRRIAAKLLGRSDDINLVPDLIYALSDTDPLVPMIAEESLRLLTRKLTVRHLAEEPNEEQKRNATKYWRQWYTAMRPDYVFLDQ